jgi:predicted small lipoprotein YifL
VRFAALLAVFAIIGGCGLKGDLYLPEEQAPASAPPGTQPGNGDGEQADEDEQS